MGRGHRVKEGVNRTADGDFGELLETEFRCRVVKNFNLYFGQAARTARARATKCKRQWPPDYSRKSTRNLLVAASCANVMTIASGRKPG